MPKFQGSCRGYRVALALVMLAICGCGDSKKPASDPLQALQGVWGLVVEDRNAAQFNGPAETFSSSPDVTLVLQGHEALLDYSDELAIGSRSGGGDMECAMQGDNLEVRRGESCLMRLKPGENDELVLLSAEAPARTIKDWSHAFSPGARFKRLTKRLPEVKKDLKDCYVYGGRGVQYLGDPAKEKPVRQVTIYYEDSGTPFYQGGWDTGKMHGSGRIYYRSGILKEEGTWIRGGLDGKFKQYTPDGRLLCMGSCNGGRVQGESEFYFRSGRVRERVTFKDGMQEGRYISYWTNGRQRFVGLYHKLYLSDSPSIEGQGTLFYENGNKQYEGEFFRGIFHGTGSFFNEKGICVYKGKWKDGDRI